MIGRARERLADVLAALGRRLLSREAEERASAAEQRSEKAEAEVEAGRRRLHTSEIARAGAERSRRIEREWNAELRDQLGRLYRARRGLTDMDDVRTLVLHTAVSLLDAEKGLLLEPPDSGDGLEVCRAEGFDNDPIEARLVRRFAGEVIARDTILREDSLDEDPEATDADREVDNLVAIPLYIADEFAGVVVAANREGGFHEHDDEVLLALGNHAGAVLDNSRLQADLRSSYLGSVRMLSEAIEAKDASLRGHAEDVVHYVLAVAEAMELGPDQRERLLFGSLLHDVGKIGISERILSKPGPLTPEERSAIELHPRIGFRLVEQVPGLRDVGLAVLHHHERWDGAGYPSGLHGDAIPLEGRIVAVADAFDAMTTDRPYRARMTVDEACAELERCAGSQFDPDVVRLFVDAVRHHPPDESAPGALAAALGDPELAHRSGPTHPYGLVGGAAAALSDPLTLLYGRRWFDAALRAAGPAAQLRAQPFTVAVVELAGLAALNDAEGLEAGDAALVEVAQAATRTAGGRQGSACRFSGARLALLLPGGGPEVEAALDGLRRELEGLRADPRCAAATWSPGEEGRDVLARARAVTYDPDAKSENRGDPMAGSDHEQGPQKPSEQRGGTTPDETEVREKGQWTEEAAEGIVPAGLGGSDAPREMLDEDPELGSAVLGETTGSDEPATQSGIDLSAGDEADATADGGPELPEGAEPDMKDGLGAPSRQSDVESSR